MSRKLLSIGRLNASMVCRRLNIEKIMRTQKPATPLNAGMAAGEARASLIHASRVAYEQSVGLSRKGRSPLWNPLLRGERAYYHLSVARGMKTVTVNLSSSARNGRI